MSDATERGYRWEIEDQTAQGLGFSAKLYRAGEPRAVAAREGFATREGAVEWATSRQRESFSVLEVVLIGVGVTAWISALVSLVRLVRGEGTVVVGQPRVVHEVRLGGSPSSTRSRGRARPIIDVEGRIKR